MCCIFRWIFVLSINFHFLTASYFNFTTGFIHMRKAGGTLIIKLLNDWMNEISCSPGGEKVSIFGVTRGIFLQGTRNIYSETNRRQLPRCPGVNVIHEEFKAIDGQALTTIPNRNIRKKNGINITIFTTFRNPIQRISSQAFYGFHNIGYQAFLLISYERCRFNFSRAEFRRSFTLCHHYNRNQSDEFILRFESTTISNISSHCECFWKAWKNSLELIRTNETLWWTWMKGEPTLGDRYISNYYLRRLFGYEIPSWGRQSFDQARSCLWTLLPHICSPKMDGYDIISALMKSSMLHPKLVNLNLSRALELGKILLREQLDFVIMDQIHTQSGRMMIRNAFFDTFSASQHYFNVENSGFMTRTGDDYRNIFPPIVLKVLKDQNRYDIELYNYAIEVFKDRSMRLISSV